MRLLLGMLIGLMLGIIGSRIFFVGSSISLLPWGIVGLGVGLFSRSKREALFNGASYGFVLTFIFMLSGYSGMRPVFSVMPFFALLGLFGALCGGILGVVGNVLRQFIRKGKRLQSNEKEVK